MTTAQPSTNGATDLAPARIRARKGDGYLLRERIIEAAVAELTNPVRTEEITVRLIAARTGVSAPAIYLHFTTKEELLFEAAKRIEHERRIRRVGRHSSANPLVVLVSRVMDVIDQVRREPEVYRLLMLTHANQTPEAFRHDRSTIIEPFDNTVALLSHAVEVGVLPPDSDPKLIASFLFVLSHGLLTFISNGSDLPWSIQLDTMRGHFTMLGRAMGASQQTIDEMVAAVDNHEFWASPSAATAGSESTERCVPFDSADAGLGGGFSLGG